MTIVLQTFIKFVEKKINCALNIFKPE